MCLREFYYQPPSLSSISGSAPWARRILITSKCPFWLAACNAVCPEKTPFTSHSPRFSIYSQSRIIPKTSLHCLPHHQKQKTTRRRRHLNFDYYILNHVHIRLHTYIHPPTRTYKLCLHLLSLSPRSQIGRERRELMHSVLPKLNPGPHRYITKLHCVPLLWP